LNTVTGYSAHAEGFGNIASGDSAHVEGGIAYHEDNYKYDAELSSATYNSSTGVLECITTTEIPDDKMSSCIMASFHFGTGTWDHKNYWIKQIEKISTTNYKLQLHEDSLSCIVNGIIPDPSTIGTIIKLTLMRHGNIASGNSSHAEGANTTASGRYSHAEGMNNTAPNEAQHVSGKFATVDETGTAIFQVGVGSSVNDRKDALRIKTDGDIIIQQDNQEIVLQDKLDSLQTTANSALTLATGVREDFDNLKIGGRNLLLNSKPYNNTNWKCHNGTISFDGNVIKGQTQSDWSRIYTDQFKNYTLIEGDEYTFSAMIRSNVAGKRVIFIGDLKGTINNIKFYEGEIGTEWTRIVKTAKVTNTNTSDSYFQITIPSKWSAGASTDEYIELKELKLEQGNKSTDWTPAPEEYFNNHISDVSLFGLGAGEVFLKVPKDTITSDDKVIIARYIRSKRRNRTIRNDSCSSTWLTYKGWVRPRKVVDGKSRDFVIPEFSATNDTPYTSFMLYDVTHKFNDTDKYQYWRLTDQGKNLVDFIVSNNVCHSGDGGEFKFANKTLGLCIQRGGVQITDYLKFTIKENHEGRLYFGRV
jgi:hypothetical protein